jgi:hypothetical protein
MGTWPLDPDEAKALVQSSASADSADWKGAVAAAVDYVSGPLGRRRDLWSTDPVPVYQATASIRLGTAMLANRWYTRRVSPLGVSQNVEFGGSDFLRQDPDIAKMLGLGSEGAFAIGGARDAELTAEGL